MIRLFMEWDTKQLDAFFRKVDSFLSGATTSVYEKLGQRVAADMREMVESGGPKGEGVTGTAIHGEAKESPKPWPPTDPQWQRLRNKDARPLYHTGRFANSFSYQLAGKSAVEVGSTDIRSRRFHFGDAALGKKWSWSAWVGPDGAIISDALANQPLGGELVTAGGGSRIKRFSPVIQQRPWMVVYDNTVSEWFNVDVGAQLGLHT